MARGKKETEEPGEEVQRPGAEGFGFLVLANAYRRAAEYGQARRVCLGGLKHHPDYLSARMALAVILLESGETEEAQAGLETVIEAAPSNILARRLLGDLYREAANVAGAKKQFEEILWLFPGHEETLKSLDELDEKAAAAGSGGTPPPEALEETVVDEEPATVEAPPEEDRDESEPLDTRILLVPEEESLAEEDPAEIKKPPSDESLEWMSEVEDIGSDLGAKPDLEEETPVEDQEPDHAPAQGDIETDSVPAAHDGPEEPAPDESVWGREEAIDRLENLLQKIQAKKSAPH